MRVCQAPFSQSRRAGDKYFIITAVSTYSGGLTTITIYGGTDYTLTNAVITENYYSSVKAPFGFPQSPAKWTVTYTDTTDRSQSSPSSGTWYNPGSMGITIPIGVWRVDYQGFLSGSLSSGDLTNLIGKATLSTANNSESDISMTGVNQMFKNTSTNQNHGTTLFKQTLLTLAAKTAYFLNIGVITNCQSIGFSNSLSTLTIRAVCAYL